MPGMWKAGLGRRESLQERLCSKQGTARDRSEAADVQTWCSCQAGPGRQQPLQTAPAAHVQHHTQALMLREEMVNGQCLVRQRLWRMDPGTALPHLQWHGIVMRAHVLLQFIVWSWLNASLASGRAALPGTACPTLKQRMQHADTHACGSAPIGRHAALPRPPAAASRRPLPRGRPAAAAAAARCPSRGLGRTYGGWKRRPAARPAWRAPARRRHARRCRRGCRAAPAAMQRLTGRAPAWRRCRARRLRKVWRSCSRTACRPRGRCCLASRACSGTGRQAAP